MASLVQPVVLAGGSGTRLWPVSTNRRPKHLLELAGEGTLLEQTLERVDDSHLFARPLIVCAALQAEEIARSAPSSQLILEPLARGSAAAIALAAQAVERDALLLVLPSDHHISDSAPLFDSVRKALPVAAEGRLVTFGIKPTNPETGYGYIAAGTQIEDGIFEAKAFIEKPQQEAASELIGSGSAYWNSGMFLFTAGALLEELGRHAPAILEATSAAMSRSAVEGDRITPDAGPLEACPVKSIDYAVMEHSNRIAVVPVELDWSDVGSWEAVYELAEKDAAGNVVDARSYVPGSRNCLVRSEGPEIVAIGVEDLVIVATADRVLVVPRAQAQRVREAAELSGKE